MTPKKILFWSHLSLGVASGLVIATVAATGMMLAFEHQIVDRAERSVRHVAAAGSARLPLDALGARASAQEKGRLSSVTVKSDPLASVSFTFGKSDTVYLDPYTGEILGHASRAQAVLKIAEDVHRRLAMDDVGRRITGVSVVVFFLQVLSGFYLWWPRKTTRLSGALQGKARDFNRHNVFGFWASPFLLIITATGIVMAHPWANALVFRITGNEPPPQRALEKPAGGGMKKPEASDAPKPALASFDRFLAEAASRAGAWESVTIRLPQRPGQPVSAFVLESEGLGVPVRSQATMDPATAEVQKWEPYAKANSAKKLLTWTRYVHSGEAGGLIGQAIAFVTAGAALVLVWTGFALSFRRLIASRRRDFVVSSKDKIQP